MKLNEAQSQFAELLKSVDTDCCAEFLSWIDDSFSVGDRKPEDESSDADVALFQIIESLKDAVPTGAILPSERTVWPEYGTDSDCNPNTTVHVDSFLFNEDDIDKLCDEGKLSRNYCRACGSQTVAPLTFISHSASFAQLKFIFSTVLPPLENRIVLDIGSRLGGVLYCAYFFNSPSKIIGVEINEDLCKIQLDIVNKFNLSERVEVICDDICNRGDVVHSADVIVLNNVFQFFLPPQQQVVVWQFLKKNIKSGTALVTMPSLNTLTEHLKLGFNMEDWVDQVPITHLVDKFKQNEEEHEELSRICLYKVL